MATISEAEYQKRIVALEKQCAVLSAEIDKQRPVVEAAVRRRHATMAIQKFWAEQDENAPYADMRIYELAGEEVSAIGMFNKAVGTYEAAKEQG